MNVTVSLVDPDNKLDPEVISELVESFTLSIVDSEGVKHVMGKYGIDELYTPSSSKGDDR